MIVCSVVGSLLSSLICYWMKLMMTEDSLPQAMLFESTTEKHNMTY
jgi:hypothetical protein